jgi:phosphoenolpyruvate phosphomutase
MEAHNALSAIIAEQAGFTALWASGLTISASAGLRDSNELSWTQMLDVLEMICDAVSIPVFVDGDTGYGNFNNVRRFVRKLEERKVSAVCIEDKVFPKRNSFVKTNHILADIDEFCGRIKAGKDTQVSEHFSIIARTEALICGLGVNEALRRAEAYYQAGADGILIHSKKDHPGEVFEFMNHWADRCPVLVVPTKYYKTPFPQFVKNKISMVIWANHNLRASIKAMQFVCKTIYETKSISALDDKIVDLDTIFSIVNEEELYVAEQRYLPNLMKGRE